MMNPRFVENALLAQTAGYAREKRRGESKLLCKHIFLLWFDKQTTHHLLPIIVCTEIYTARAQHRTVRVAYNLLISEKKAFFRREGVDSFAV